ncbi:protransforming growth factor alpha [Onychostruthus taczanowskii]|uniref:protransforming growth factor alpha n=1 Tax=Onychostruthus taczanowskii TaxID=356909 RepID=UPI001B80B127|nr:protransforming growth factor alpha [Onychostruthus taczanowskii]
MSPQGANAPQVPMSPQVAVSPNVPMSPRVPVPPQVAAPPRSQRPVPPPRARIPERSRVGSGAAALTQLLRAHNGSAGQTGVLLAACHALDNSTAGRSAPVAAAVRSHFNECPDSHRQFCFHGTCRFLVQEEKPACVCHSGSVGTRCEHADLLAVVAATQKKQTITALLVVAVVASALLVTACVLLQ